MPAHPPEPIESRWDDGAAASLSEPELLLYRSNLLGADLRVTNFAGGNTSAKIAAADPLSGEEVLVLWVKGSGGDLGSMDLGGFATLYQEKLLALERLYRGIEHEDEMVGYLPHCTFDLNPRAASIDTPLHAFVPHRHVDHMHPDAVIALAASADGERLTREAFGDDVGWVPWQRPGFDLGLKLGSACAARPGLRGLVLGGHGLFSWGATSKECYENTLAIIRRATEFLAERGAGAPFGGRAIEPLEGSGRQELLLRTIPALRGALGREVPKVAHFDGSPDVLELVCSERLRELAALGTSCPDHFLRTKIWPLVLELASEADVATQVARYRARYAAYYERRKRAGSPPMRDPNPVVVLLPGVGMLTFAKDKPTARVSAEFYVNAIHVMRGANAVSEYRGLDEQEAFDIEYWQLEEAKLGRLPPPAPLTGRIAWITGGAGGIGRACAARMLADGACVCLVDVDEAALDEAALDLAQRFGRDRVRAMRADVTSEDDVRRAVEGAVLEYGGIDLLVANAGLASAAAFEDTTTELWQESLAVLGTGYFLASREVYRVLLAQGTGGSIVFVGSKNALAASKQASAYSVAKASELHLARCLALEGAEHGIRVNVVNPDAVLRGSRIWSGGWRRERAAAYGIAEDELEEHYRKRSLLGLSVYPEDVAEAVAFFASERSAKSTGNVLNVDAGNAAAFPR